MKLLKDNAANNKRCEVVLSTSLVVCAAPNTCWEQNNTGSRKGTFIRESHGTKEELGQ